MSLDKEYLICDNTCDVLCDMLTKSKPLIRTLHLYEEGSQTCQIIEDESNHILGRAKKCC